MRRLVPFIAVLSLAALCSAQTELGGKGQFPEFRNLSGLPGGEFGVLRDGTPSILGALAFSTPIAYSLGHRHFAFAIANTSADRKIRFFERNPNSNQVNRSNGSAAGVIGFSGRYGDLTVGGMILSSKLDNVLNLEWTPPQHDAHLTYAVGVQDAFSTGGSSGDTIDNPQGGGNSQSPFAVVTYSVGHTAYVSAGIGRMRFRTAFANASVNIQPRIKAMGEYDGFNWNFGLAGDLGGTRIVGRDVRATVFLGAVRGKYATWGLALHF